MANHLRSARWPPPPSSKRFSVAEISRQLWLSGTTRRPSPGLYEDACQLWPPAVLGHTDTHSPISAEAMSSR